jgi:hypothetical protein
MPSLVSSHMVHTNALRTNAHIIQMPWTLMSFKAKTKASKLVMKRDNLLYRRDAVFSVKNTATYQTCAQRNGHAPIHPLMHAL